LASAPGSAAAERPSVEFGFDAGGGVSSYQPAPLTRARVLLPSPVIAMRTASLQGTEVRLRWNAVQMLYAAMERDLFELHLDTAVLPVLPRNAAGLRPVAGPLLGLRIVAGPDSVHPGAVLGGRVGIDWMASPGGVRVGLSAEPYFEVRGGAGGVLPHTPVYGGGVQLVFGLLAPSPFHHRARPTRRTQR